jgi:hypothetical protein
MEHHCWCSIHPCSIHVMKLPHHCWCSIHPCSIHVMNHPYHCCCGSFITNLITIEFIFALHSFFFSYVHYMSLSIGSIWFLVYFWFRV